MLPKGGPPVQIEGTPSVVGMCLAWIHEPPSADVGCEYWREAPYRENNLSVMECLWTFFFIWASVYTAAVFLMW